MTIDKYLTQIEDMNDRVIAVTGATSGVGLKLIEELIKKHASVIMLARNLDKANKIKESLLEKYPNSNIGIVLYDQASFKKIKEGIDELNKSYPNVDTIMLNAGVLSRKGRTEDDYPLTFGVNYLGVRHFIEYTSKVFNKKIKFVVQGSIVAGLNLPRRVDINTNKPLSLTQYNVSKIYLEAYIHYLYVDNTYPNFEYVITEPGVSGTKIVRDLPWLVKVLGRPFMKVFFHSPKKACLTALTGISKLGKNGDLITPRGLLTIWGYPKIKEFPEKREREYLFLEE